MYWHRFATNGWLSFALEIHVYDSPERTDIGMNQDYFSKTIGHVKKVLLTYGPQGRSRGIAQIIFSGPNSGPEAAKQLDGVKVDNKAMKVSSALGRYTITSNQT